MSPTAVRILWKWLAPAILVGGLLAWAHAVGAQIANPFGLGYTSPRAVLFSLPWLSVLLIGAYWLGFEFARANIDKSWTHRIPIYFFDPKDIDLDTSGGRLLQVLSVVGFYVLPVLSLIALFIQFRMRPIFCDNPEGLVQAYATLVPTANKPCPSFYRFADQSGPQYFLWVSPWVYATLMATALTLWSAALFQIFKESSKLKP